MNMNEIIDFNPYVKPKKKHQKRYILTTTSSKDDVFLRYRDVPTTNQLIDDITLPNRVGRYIIILFDKK